MNVTLVTWGFLFWPLAGLQWAVGTGAMDPPSGARFRESS